MVILQEKHQFFQDAVWKFGARAEFETNCYEIRNESYFVNIILKKC
jgi:hypothetical protein